jgi:heterodisulfide reductase subunit D
MHLLGRDLVFEAPRDVLAAISGVEVVEFEKNREWQLCCGAGGGIKVQDPSLALTIGSRKVDDAGRLRAGVIATTCPFCRRNLGDACTASGSQFEVLDVIQLAERMME